MLKPTANSLEIMTVRSHYGKRHIQYMSDYFVSSLCITKPNFEQFYQKQQFFFCSKYYQEGNKSKKCKNHRRKNMMPDLCSVHNMCSFGFNFHICLCYSKTKHKNNLSQSSVWWRIICYNFLNPFTIAFVIAMFVQQNPPTMLPCNAAKSSKSAGPRINCLPLEVNGRTAYIVSSVCVKRIFRKSTINSVLISAIQKKLVQH